MRRKGKTWEQDRMRLEIKIWVYANSKFCLSSGISTETCLKYQLLTLRKLPWKSALSQDLTLVRACYCLTISPKYFCTFKDFSQFAHIFINNSGNITFYICLHNVQCTYFDSWPICSGDRGMCVLLPDKICDLISAESFFVLLRGHDYCITTLDGYLTFPTGQFYCLQAPALFNHTSWLRILTFEQMACSTFTYPDIPST